jgi:hypothetical protein
VYEKLNEVNAAKVLYVVTLVQGRILILDYQPAHASATSGHADRIRPERHNLYSIVTLRILLVGSLLRQLCCCPFCGSQRL